MGGDGDPTPERVLDRVAARRDVLGAVEGDEAVHVRDLRDALDLSRSTVYEATRELAAEGLLCRDDGFELTPFGRIAVDLYDRSVGALATACAIREALAGLPADATLDPVVCRDAEVVRAEPHAPDRPFEAVGEFFEGATRMKGWFPVTGARYVEGLDEALAADESFAIEVLTERRVVEYLLSNHPDAVESWVESERVQLYETGTRLPFGLLIEEEPDPSVGVLLYDEAGQHRVLLAAEGRMAVAWGRGRFADRRASATELGGDRLG
ncbi:MAG: helix-turn-helix transcriptional regulator [Haloferacaceae archaeon]